MFDLSLYGPTVGAETRRSILVVDDDASIKPILAKVLYSIDPKINLTWVSSLTEARNELSIAKRGLVISDYYLSKTETGMELWKFCRERFQTIPFILISGYSIHDIEHSEKHMDPLPLFLRKTQPLRDIRFVIESLLSGRDG